MMAEGEQKMINHQKFSYDHKQSGSSQTTYFLETLSTPDIVSKETSSNTLYGKELLSNGSNKSGSLFKELSLSPEFQSALALPISTALKNQKEFYSKSQVLSQETEDGSEESDFIVRKTPHNSLQGYEFKSRTHALSIPKLSETQSKDRTDMELEY